MALSSRATVPTTALLLVGNTVGAGILGIPVTTGLAGFLPSMLAITAGWGLMLLTARVLADGIVRERRQGMDLPSLFEPSLGPLAKNIAIATYLLLFYGVLIAYLAGASAVLSSLLGMPGQGAWLLLGFFVVAGGFTLFGVKLVHRGNALFLLVMGIAFVVLLFKCSQSFDPALLSYHDWPFLPGAVPIILCAFCFHNLIPLVCSELSMEKDRIEKTLYLGTGIVFAINVLWMVSVLGSLPASGPGQANLEAAFRLNQPATIPLAAALHSPAVTLSGAVFSLLALFTSFVGVGLGFMNFLKDLLSRWSAAGGKGVLATLTFLPPLCVSLLYPDFFLEALNLTGGVCLVVLFGLLPALMACKPGRRGSKWKRAGGWTMIVLFSLALLLEIFQEAGWLVIDPRVDHWVIHLPGLG